MQRHVIATVVLVGLAHGGLALADTPYARRLDEYTLEKAQTKAAKLVEENDIKLTGEQFMTRQPVAITDDMMCPGIDLEVVNGSDHTIWKVEVELLQKLGTRKETKRLHLPYLAAQTKARVSFSCLEDSSYSYRYSYNADQLEISYFALGESTLALALTEMGTQKVDATLTASTVTASPGTQTLLAAALAMADARIAKELVAGIAASGIGGKELGEAIERDPESAVAAEVANSIAKLPPAQQAKLARALLASEAAEQWSDKLVPIIDQRLCTGARADVVGLWLMAQNPKAIPVAALRERVRARCKLLPSDGGAFVTALDRDPQYARALDTLDDAMFAGVAASWKAKPASPSSIAFAAATQNVKRFDTAIALVPQTAQVDAITMIVETEEDLAADIAEHKAAWIAGAVAKVSELEVVDVVAGVFTSLVEGRVKHPKMRDAVRATKSRAPAEADGILIKYGNENSKVYDVKQLAEAGVDPTDFLAFNATSLVDCQLSLDTLRRCATAIASNPALVKSGGKAVKSEFTSAVEHMMTVADKDEMVEVSQVLHAAGISVGFVVDRLCRDARDAIRYNGDFEGPLAYVKQVPGGESCVAAIGDEAASKRRNIIIMTILAIVGLILPMPIGWLMMRWRWRKMKAALPVVATDETRAGARLDDRLGSAGLGRALGGAVAEARRETALRGLDGVDAAMIERVAGVVRRAVKSGDAASLLTRTGSDAIYVVALPVRHARPQVVQRYLGAEWPEHVEQIRAAAGGAITTLVVLCGPDATEATLLVGSSDGTTSSDPDALLDAREARDRGANTFRGVMALATTTPITSTPSTGAAA